MGDLPRGGRAHTSVLLPPPFWPEQDNDDNTDHTIDNNNNDNNDDNDINDNNDNTIDNINNNDNNGINDNDDNNDNNQTRLNEPAIRRNASRNAGLKNTKSGVKLVL